MRVFLFNLLLILHSSAFASIPLSLIYQNKPVDPLCLSENHYNELSKCGINAEPDLVASGDNEILKAKGYYGYEYQVKNSGQSRGYSYYKVIGKSGNKIIVNTVSSGGGSGEFTAILLVSRNADKLKITTVASGDRCNSGVSHPEVKNDRLIYRSNMTPLDYTGLAHSNPHLLKSMDDLQYCAACCAGYAVYSFPLKNEMENTKFLYVDFKDYPAKELAKLGDKPYQRCFDKLIADYQSQGKTRLVGKAAAEFALKFYSLCYRK
jgi:hypothetical protein